VATVVYTDSAIPYIQYIQYMYEQPAFYVYILHCCLLWLPVFLNVHAFFVANWQ